MSVAVVVVCLFTGTPAVEENIPEAAWMRATRPVGRFELTALGRAAAPVEKYAFDVDGHLTHEEQRARPSAPPIADLDPTYDADDRIQRVRGIDGSGASVDQHHTYELDTIEDHGHACHPTYTWASDGSYVMSDRLFFDKHDRLVQSGHGYPERIENAGKLVAAWRNSYDRAGRLDTSDDGAVVHVDEWNSHGDIAEIAEKRGGRTIAKTIFTYVYR